MSDLNATLPLSARIEAILFWKGEPVSMKELSKILQSSSDEISSALAELEAQLQNRGIMLMRVGEEVGLATHPEAGAMIEALTRESLSKDLGKAGLETLAIILYRGPVTRADIDYIRGVNSQFIVRTLLVRGLVEKVTDPKDERRFLYKPSFELLQYLGVSNVEQMPEFQEVKHQMESFEANNQNTSHGEQTDQQHTAAA